ncbi:MAG: YufK family protein [Lysinibacillus sp.]|nr:YufK family protein [Lysinibacillus sp.]
MRNPYLYGYLPLFSIMLYSLTFGIYMVGVSVEFFRSIGVYAGMQEFLSDIEISVLLLFVFFLCFFMLFSALKLIGETIHELAMLFFSKDSEGGAVRVARGGYVIFFFGGLLSSVAIQSFTALMIIFIVTIFCSFVYTVYKMSQFMSLTGMVGLIIFEIVFWGIFITAVIYVCLKLYNGILASLPFAN